MESPRETLIRPEKCKASPHWKHFKMQCSSKSPFLGHRPEIWLLWIHLAVGRIRGPSGEGRTVVCLIYRITYGIFITKANDQDHKVTRRQGKCPLTKSLQTGRSKNISLKKIILRLEILNFIKKKWLIQGCLVSRLMNCPSFFWDLGSFWDMELCILKWSWSLVKWVELVTLQ